MTVFSEAIVNQFQAEKLTINDLPTVLEAIEEHFGIEVVPKQEMFDDPTYTYVDPDDRYIAAYVTSFSEEEISRRSGGGSPAEAACRLALNLLRGPGSEDTSWVAIDRKDGAATVVEQDDFLPGDDELFSYHFG